LPAVYNPPDVNLIAAYKRKGQNSELSRWAMRALVAGLVLLLVAVSAKSLIDDPTFHPSWPRPEPDDPWLCLLFALSLVGLSFFLDFRHSRERKEIARLREPVPLVPFEALFEPLLHNRTKLKIHVTLRMPQEHKTPESCQLLLEAGKAALARKLYRPDSLSADPYQELHDFIGRALAPPARELHIPVLLWAITEIEGLPPNSDARTDRIFL
jgi:hypothetical protein